MFDLRRVLVVLFVFFFTLHGGIAFAWQVRSYQKIDSQTGGFGGLLTNYAFFGQAVAPLGDLDGDGHLDLAVGTAGQHDGQPGAGAVWILFLNPDGTVRAEQKISATAGGFTGTLDQNDFFGGAVANLGDLDGDGVVDLAVGAFEDDDGGVNRGAVWILFTDRFDRAAAEFRNGSGVNPPCFTNTGLPVVGATWTADIDTSGHPGAFLCYALCYGGGASGITTGFGEVLVDLGSGLLYTAVAVSAGAVAHIVEALPSDTSLVGAFLSTQAVITGNGLELCNALDLVIGY